MKRLWLVRHARPLVDPGVCYGRLDVAAEDEHTRLVAAEIAARLPGSAVLRCSPRQRCAKLAEALCEVRPDLGGATASMFDERLAEMDFGSWEGRSWESLGAAELQAWTDDFSHHAPGGGESVHQFMRRVNQALQAFKRADEARQNQVWITHAGVIRATQLLLQGWGTEVQASDWPRSTVPFGSWLCLDIR